MHPRRELLRVLMPAAMLAACGGDTSGDDHVLCHCLFGFFTYTANACTINDIPPDHPAYGGSRVHQACVSKCGESLGPLAFLGASNTHEVILDGSCRASTSSSTDPLLGADGPDTMNYTFIPSWSRAVLRRPGMFGLIDLSSVDLSLDAPRGIDDGVAGEPVTIKKVMLRGDFAGSFDGHTLHQLLFSLGDGFIDSTTNGVVAVEHPQQVNGIPIAAGQPVLFSGEIDGVMRHITMDTTTAQSLQVLRYGAPGAYQRRIHYTATIPIPQTPYEIFLDLYFDAPLVAVTVVKAVFPTYINPTTTKLSPNVIGADTYKWFHPFTGKLVSTESTPTFDMKKLNADCIVLWAEDSENKVGQDQLVCLSKQGCSKACLDLAD